MCLQGKYASFILSVTKIENVLSIRKRDRRKSRKKSHLNINIQRMPENVFT